MSRTRTCLFFLFLLAVIVCLFGLAAFLVPQQAEAAFGPPTPNLTPIQRFTLSFSLLIASDILIEPAGAPGEEVAFAIQPGDPTPTVIQRLVESGLIVDAGSFRNYLIYTGIDTRLKTGQFRLSTGMTPIEIAQAIQGFTATEAVITILAGWRLEEVASAIPTSGLEITAESFLSTAQNQPRGVLGRELPEASTHEGFLFPGVYTVPRQTTSDQLLRVFLASFEANVTEEVRSGFVDQGVSLYEGVILASIVEREAVVDGEQALIASVFFNRLRQGMMLQADPTVQYALGYNDAWGWWKSPLSLDDLNTASPYNTYLNPALPPAPIANPGLEALRGAAFPEETDYYFFRAACDGSGRHVFATTFEEHQANACP